MVLADAALERFLVNAEPFLARWKLVRQETFPGRTTLTLTPLTQEANQLDVLATPEGKEVRLRLNDGTEEVADHLLLGTGYKIDLTRHRFLSHGLLDAIRTVNGYPVLDGGFQSSVPGLYFVGAPGAHSFGPLCRFVVGSRFAAHTLTRSIRKLPSARQMVTVPS